MPEAKPVKSDDTVLFWAKWKMFWRISKRQALQKGADEMDPIEVRKESVVDSSIRKPAMTLKRVDQFLSSSTHRSIQAHRSTAILSAESEKNRHLSKVLRLRRSELYTSMQNMIRAFSLSLSY